jgi:hypothetical protein
MSYQNRRFLESYLPAFKRSVEKKNILRIISELMRLTWKWKCLPYHYFRYALYNKKYNYSEILNYLPETIFYYRILPLINKKMFLLDNKNIFEELISGHEIKYPKTIVKIIKKTVFNANLEIISDEEGLQKALQQSETNVLFCKPADCSSGGKDIFILKRKNELFVDEKDRIFNLKYLNKLAFTDWIIQESVENCDILKNIYQYAINSFRVLTYFYPNRGAKALYCMLKFGNNMAFTDNAHSGGMYVKINLKTGELDNTAYDENLFTYTAHPRTGVIFAGKKIENIGAVIKLAEKLGNIYPNSTFVGWDIALTPEGPVVLEGNSSPGLTIIQRTHNGMKEFINLTIKIRAIDK